jgi:very-short-patch-repair endonuclease
MMYNRRNITKEMVEAIIEANPDITHRGLAKKFGCSVSCMSRYLSSYGLHTKPWTERKHSDATKAKISESNTLSGRYKGEKNPNYGKKSRPWLEGENHPFRKYNREHPDRGEKQKGAANPIHKVKYLYEDPEYVKNITRGFREFTDKKRGSTYEEVYGAEKAAAYKEKLRAASPARLLKIKRKDTEPERIMYAILGSLNVPFECQVVFGYHTVDFFIPSCTLVIQVDGDYWHANPLFYGQDGKPLSKAQKKVQQRDSACNTFLSNRGIPFLRFWEHDLKTQLDACVIQIKEKLDDYRKD